MEKAQNFWQTPKGKELLKLIDGEFFKQEKLKLFIARYWKKYMEETSYVASKEGQVVAENVEILKKARDYFVKAKDSVEEIRKALNNWYKLVGNLLKIHSCLNQKLVDNEKKLESQLMELSQLDNVNQPPESLKALLQQDNLEQQKVTVFSHEERSYLKEALERICQKEKILQTALKTANEYYNDVEDIRKNTRQAMNEGHQLVRQMKNHPNVFGADDFGKILSGLDYLFQKDSHLEQRMKASGFLKTRMNLQNLSHQFNQDIAFYRDCCSTIRAANGASQMFYTPASQNNAVVAATPIPIKSR